MKQITAILFAFVLAIPAFAQGKFGADSAECIKHLSYYSEYVKQNNLAEAAPFWRQAMSLCPPTANQRMLLDGAKILRREISVNAKDPVRRQQLIDSLLMLHDVRAQYYPKYKNSSLSNKAIDIINYYKSDKMESYRLIKPILAEVQSAASPVVFINLMQISVDLYKEGKIGAPAVMNDYTEIADYMDKAPLKDVAPAKITIETILAESGVASCENLVPIFTPRYEQIKSDKGALTSMVKILTKSNCTSDELYLKAVESLYNADPSKESAYFLYKLYSSRDENTKAAKALEEAIGFLNNSNPDDVRLFADYKFELASFYFKKLGNGSKAIDIAKEVPDYNPDMAGKAYLLIGTIWGSQKCHGNEVEVRAPFWVAVDYMKKAKAADETLANEADNLIAQYRKYYPQQADAFMYDVIDGSRYIVDCNGMREATTVRTAK